METDSVNTGYREHLRTRQFGSLYKMSLITIENLQKFHIWDHENCLLFSTIPYNPCPLYLRLVNCRSMYLITENICIDLPY